MKNVNNNKNNINAGKSAQINKNAKQSMANNDLQNEAQPIRAEQSSSEYSAIIGRSQVSFKGDNFANDVKLFVNNTELAKKATILGDIAYEQMKDKHPNAYEYSCALEKEFFNESKS